jgi:hypothetical protein
MTEANDEKGPQNVGPDRPPREPESAHADRRSAEEEGRPKGKHDPSAGRDGA